MAKNPWKLFSTPFSSWSRKDFNRDETSWEKVLRKGRKISITDPQSSRWRLKGDDYKPYTTDELEKGNTSGLNVKTGMYGEAEGDVDRARVDSTAVKMISYDPKTKDLEVVFHGGDKAYIYPNVPVEEFEALMKAESKGKYMAYVITPKYSTTYSK